MEGKHVYGNVTRGEMHEHTGSLAQMLRGECKTEIAKAARAIDTGMDALSQKIVDEAQRVHDEVGTLVRLETGARTELLANLRRDLMEEVQTVRTALEEYRRDELRYRNDLASRTVLGRARRVWAWLVCRVVGG